MVGAPAQARAPRTLRNRTERLTATVALATYLGLALAVTWPWVLDPGSTLYGVRGGDLTANVAQFQQFADERQLPFLPGALESLNAPEGLESPWALHLAGVGSAATIFVLSVLFGSVAAHGIVAIGGYVGSAFAMFLFARRITGHAGAAFVAGLAFGFWPYSYGTGWTWPHYIQSWVFVLLAWRMLVAAEQPTIRNGLLAGGATVVAMTWIQYNLLIAGVLYVTLALGALGYGRLRGTLGAQGRAQAAAAAVVVVVAAGVLLAAVSQDFRGAPTRTAADAVSNSARPLMYLLPGSRHPLLGSSVGDWLEDKYPNPLFDPTSTAAFANIYLGIPLMLIGLGGMAFALAALVRRRRTGGMLEPPAGVGLMAMCVGAVGLLFSAPPQVRVLGISVPLPYQAVAEVTTVFRVAHRFALLAMIGLCVLVAIGLSRVLRGRGLAFQAIALASVAVVVGVDLWARPQPVTSELGRPKIYELLKGQAPGIVAEYPFRGAGWTQNVESLYQPVHGHPLFTGYDPGTEADSRKSELQYLSERRTAPLLARYGVRYIIVHDAGEGHPRSVPKPGELVPGARLIGQTEDSALYRLVSRPAAVTSYAVSGFNGPEGRPPGVVRWLGENGGRIELVAPCRPCVGEVVFRSGTFARPRLLTVRNRAGRVIHRQSIDGPGETVRFAIGFSRRTTMVFSTDPPPDRINEMLGGKDTRFFGVFVSVPVRLGLR